ncbi:MAG: guanylate kinase [Planctomycetes bacterium]|nr:guanylate kinase [Planctomycetota bacterium]
MSNDDSQGRGLLVVISGPSGVGKTTIVKAVKERLNGIFSVSATTRPRSEQEQDGVDYYFLTEEEFQRRLDAGQMLEHAQVFGRHRYGTPRQPVIEALDDGHLVILEIDVQGACQVRASAPDAFMIFIMPPNEAALLERLRGRGRDTEEAIQRRFEEAQREIGLAHSRGVYDAFVRNDELARAQDETCELIRSRQLSAVSCQPE